jgi:hypothetical protein
VEAQLSPGRIPNPERVDDHERRLKRLSLSDPIIDRQGRGTRNKTWTAGQIAREGEFAVTAGRHHDADQVPLIIFREMDGDFLRESHLAASEDTST